MKKKKPTKPKTAKRKWLPNFSDLIDRLTIHQLKEVFIQEHKEKYRSEMNLMIHDLDIVIKDGDVPLTGEMIRLIAIMAQINCHIWYNESKARKGEDQDLALLRLTHGLNGIRSRAGNRLLELANDGERKDYKTDCLAAEGFSAIFSLLIMRVPEVGFSVPAIIRMVVVLPAPLGPRKP